MSLRADLHPLTDDVELKRSGRLADNWLPFLLPVSLLTFPQSTPQLLLPDAKHYNRNWLWVSIFVPFFVEAVSRQTAELTSERRLRLCEETVQPLEMQWRGKWLTAGLVKEWMEDQWHISTDTLSCGRGRRVCVCVCVWERERERERVLRSLFRLEGFYFYFLAMFTEDSYTLRIEKFILKEHDVTWFRWTVLCFVLE